MMPWIHLKQFAMFAETQWHCQAVEMTAIHPQRHTPNSDTHSQQTNTCRHTHGREETHRAERTHTHTHTQLLCAPGLTHLQNTHRTYPAANSKQRLFFNYNTFNVLQISLYDFYLLYKWYNIFIYKYISFFFFISPALCSVFLQTGSAFKRRNKCPLWKAAFVFSPLVADCK